MRVQEGEIHIVLNMQILTIYKAPINKQQKIQRMLMKLWAIQQETEEGRR